jgi:CPA2 family monovalent cation:H+ antiporter-2
MTPPPLLKELAVIAAAGTAVTAILARLRLPAVAGLLVAGALLGPHGLRLVSEVKAIEALAEVGVVLLLFSIGLEFSLSRLKHIFRRVALGGAVQVVATAGAAAGVALLLGESVPRAVFYGFVFAMSSTAIVLRALADRGESDAPHGRFIVGTLIFQDLCVVPMVLILPVLAVPRPAAAVAIEVSLALGKAAGVVVATLLVARILVPRLLRAIDATRSRELFLLAVVAICVGTALTTSLVGLSLALGAFLGGMVVADTEFQHRAMGDIIPLRDAFVSVFFVSLGMLFDGRVLLARPALVALLLCGFVAGKAVIAMISAAVMRFPARASWLAGIGLAQFSEFGFVLCTLAMSLKLIGAEAQSALLAAGILSMFLTPLLIRLAPHLTAGERLIAPLSRLLGVRTVDEPESAEETKHDVIVIGYGIAGREVARAISASGLSFIALELNAETVRRAREEGEPVFYADATSPEALEHAQVQGARAVVVLINDPQAALRVVDTVHRVAPAVPVLVRTRYFADRGKLHELGASEVVAEEVEASLEVMARLLRRLEVPRNLIESQVRVARLALHSGDRRLTLPRVAVPELEALAGLNVENVLVEPRWHAAGRSAVELALRKQTRALIVALRRDGALVDDPDPAEQLRAGDEVYLCGSRESIARAVELLEHGPRPA